MSCFFMFLLVWPYSAASFSLSAWTPWLSGSRATRRLYRKHKYEGGRLRDRWEKKDKALRYSNNSLFSVVVPTKWMTSQCLDVCCIINCRASKPCRACMTTTSDYHGETEKPDCQCNGGEEVWRTAFSSDTNFPFSLHQMVTWRI